MRRIGIVVVVLVCALAAAAQTPQYPLRQYLSIRAAASPTLSPDGSQVAFLMRVTGTSQVWRVASGSGWPDQLTFLGGNIGSVAWSPTGDWVLVTADHDGDEQYQLYLVKADGTETAALTSDPKVRHLFGGWSHDGRQIFYASNKRNPRFTDCYVMDIRTRQEKRVFQKDASLSASALSRDGRTIIATDSASNFDSTLYAVDTQTGQSREMTHHSGDARINAIDFSADGKTLYITSDEGREFVNLAALDMATGKRRFLHDDSMDVDNALLSPNARTIAYIVNREGYQDLRFWDVTGNQPVKTPRLPEGTVAIGGYSRDGQRLALTIGTPTLNGDVFVLDTGSSKLVRSTFSSLAGSDPRTFVQPRLVHYKTFDNREIPAFLYEPRSNGSGVPAPVILSVHGGPESQERPLFSPLYQYFVSRGYAVLAPNIRGSAGYGKTYLALDNGPKRWDALKDLNAAVDWVGTQPGLDAKRVAIFGGSYGGFAVLAMLAHYPNRFAAGIDMFGVTDFKTFLKNTSAYRRANRAAEYGDPEKDSVYMDAVSPALHADKIRAPLFVLQGTNDPRVPESESAQIVAKVKAAGGTVEYLLFPDEGHGFTKLPNRIKAYESVVAFLDKYMCGPVGNRSAAASAK
jgi:dipeptidyl aminopeptidase/acylaminoacyl peptidase